MGTTGGWREAETNYLGGELQVNLGFVRQALLQLGPGLPQSAEEQIRKEGEEDRMCVTSQDHTHTHLSDADARGGSVEQRTQAHARTDGGRAAGPGAKVHRYTRSRKSPGLSRGPQPVQQMMRMYGTGDTARPAPPAFQHSWGH